MIPGYGQNPKSGSEQTGPRSQGHCNITLPLHPTGGSREGVEPQACRSLPPPNLLMHFSRANGQNLHIIGTKPLGFQFPLTYLAFLAEKDVRRGIPAEVPTRSQIDLLMISEPIKLLLSMNYIPATGCSPAEEGGRQRNKGGTHIVSGVG